MARRSARLSSRNSATPQPIKRVSLAHDALVHAPRTVPSKLSSLQENEEMPGSFPESPTTSMLEQPFKRARIEPATPKRASAIVPSREEMHPQATHQTTVKADQEARWLGFSAMLSTTKVPLKQADESSTPIKSSAVKLAQSPEFKFTFQREQSLELSPAAKSLMQEKRAEAARIKEQMKSNGEGENIASSLSRKIATPKSQKSRFSDAHNAQFEKMDSIAGHASALRKSPHRAQSMVSPSKITDSPAMKRSPSKSVLPALATTPSKPQPSLKRKAETQLTKVASEQDNQNTPTHKPAGHEERGMVVQPRTTSTFEHLSTPTKSSLARSNSVKSLKDSKIPAPCASTPSKTVPCEVKPATPFLSKSPLKTPGSLSIVGRATTAIRKNNLLSRSPVRPAANLATGLDSTSSAATHPVQHTTTEAAQEATHDSNPFNTTTPLHNQNKAGNNDLLGRFNRLRASPIKSILRTPQRLYSNDPAKVAAGTHFATPPQAKGQLGRKIPATAPVRKQVDFTSSTKAREATKEASLSPFTTVPQQKTVPIVSATTPSTIAYPCLDDFTPVDTASVQERRQSSGPRNFTFRVGSNIVFAPSTTPTKPTSPLRASSTYTIRHVAPEPEVAGRKDESKANDAKQRKIRFENAQSVAQVVVSPTVTLGSKKRKFDFENELAEKDVATSHIDKENMPEESGRPAKRMKPSTSPKMNAGGVKRASSAEVKTRTTLGVKPKSAVGKAPEKKSGSKISLARLNALAMPKKRG